MILWTDETAPLRGELQAQDGSRWIVVQRELSAADGKSLEDADAITITHQLVRAGSPADPRHTQSEGL